MVEDQLIGGRREICDGGEQELNERASVWRRRSKSGLLSRGGTHVTGAKREDEVVWKEQDTFTVG